MNKNHKSTITEYFTTIVVSLFVVFVIAFALELELLFRSEKIVNMKELSVANLSNFLTIEELEKQLNKTPEDIIINIRLANEYAKLGKLDKANQFFKNALTFSGRSNYALYSYAIFCAKNGMYLFAATLAEELSGNDRKTNQYKAKIYEEIADVLDKNQDFPAAVKSYQIVYKYAKSLGDLKYINQIKNKYSKEFVKLADYNILKKDTQEAISNLKNSLKIKKNAVANYKLGLIYLDIDKSEAEKYMNEAFFEDAHIVNPMIYHALLSDLLAEAKVLGDDGLQNYYNSRMKRFKKTANEVLLFKDDIVIENTILKYKKKFLMKNGYGIYFDLKNNTQDEIKNLSIKAELYINNNKYLLDKKIVTPPNILDIYTKMDDIEMLLPKEVKTIEPSKNNDIFVKFYARKTQDSPWVLIKIDFLNY